MHHLAQSRAVPGVWERGADGVWEQDVNALPMRRVKMWYNVGVRKQRTSNRPSRNRWLPRSQPHDWIARGGQPWHTSQPPTT